MTLQEIKNAVDQGKDIFWKNDRYKVVAGIEKAVGKYFVVCTANSHTIGLTWRDGKTMNGAEEDFYLGNDNS